MLGWAKVSLWESGESETFNNYSGGSFAGTQRALVEREKSLWNVRKHDRVTEKAHGGRGYESIWEMSVDSPGRWTERSCDRCPTQIDCRHGDIPAGQQSHRTPVRQKQRQRPGLFVDRVQEEPSAEAAVRNRSFLGGPGAADTGHDDDLPDPGARAVRRVVAARGRAGRGAVDDRQADRDAEQAADDADEDDGALFFGPLGFFR